MMSRKRWGCGVGLFGVWLLGCGAGAPEAKEPEPPVRSEAPASSSSQRDLKQAIAEIQEQHFEAAKALLVKAQAKNPKHAETAFYLGVANEGLNDPEQAEAEYKKALALEPRLSDASVNLSALLIGKGALKEALEIIDRGLTASPGDEGLLNNRAMALSQSGDVKGAAETYAELLRKRPDDVEIKALYAEALLNAGENQRALEVAESLLTSDKREVLGLAADLFGRSKAFDRCIAALDKAIAIQDAAELRVHRGMCQHGKRDESKAEVDFQAATKLDPKNAAAFYYLGKSSIILGKTKQAKAALKEAETLAGETDLGKAAKKALAELK